MENEGIMKTYIHNFVGPILVEYTKWIIEESRRRGLKKIYFLARDGYLLCDIAKKICKENNLDIDCRYLYCSRFSLRLASFHILEREAMFNLLFASAKHLSLQVVLERAGLTEKEIKNFAFALGVENLNERLSEDEFDRVTKKLKSDNVFIDKALKNSKEVYQNTLHYFKQEKVFEGDFIIADSGWIGSMQKSFSKLLTYAGYNGNILGYYFGLYTKTNKDYGQFFTYYFSYNKGLKRKIMFNNNLFEIMLSANHGTTLGYKKIDEKFVPILKEETEEFFQFVNKQIYEIRQYLTSNADLNLKDFTLKKSRKKCYKKIKKCMVYPSKDQLKLLSTINFCDDPSDCYRIPLCDKSLTKELKKQLLVCRVLKSVFGVGNSTPLFWKYGIIRYLSKPFQILYRTDAFLQEFLISIIKRFR